MYNRSLYVFGELWRLQPSRVCCVGSGGGGGVVFYLGYRIKVLGEINKEREMPNVCDIDYQKGRVAAACGIRFNLTPSGDIASLQSEQRQCLQMMAYYEEIWNKIENEILKLQNREVGNGATQARI